MTKPAPKHVKAMVSYAWTTPGHTSEHEDRVQALVDELITKGIDVVFDKYDLRDGDDVNTFMEQVAAQGNVKKVIAICDPNYVEKMNARAGGAGQEGMLMSTHVIDQLRGTDQETGERERRFIPVIFACAEGTRVADACNRPTMFGSMKFIDMSTDEAYDANFDQLMRFLLDRPALVRPALGNVPEHLQETSPAPLSSQPQFLTLQRALEQNRATKRHWREYLEQVEQALHQIKPATSLESEWLYDFSIANAEATRFVPIRDQFVQALKLGIQHDLLPIDEFVKFFENVMCLSERLPDQYRRDSFIMSTALFNHVDFLVAELTLYTVALLISEAQVEALKAITEHTYFVQIRHHERPVDFTYLNRISYQSELENQLRGHYNSRWISPVGGWLHERATLKSINVTALTQADIMLYIKSKLEAIDQEDRMTWYCTIGNFIESAGILPLFSRFVSKRSLAPWISFFNAKNENLVRVSLDAAFPDNTFGRGLNERWRNVSLNGFLKLDTWATLR